MVPKIYICRDTARFYEHKNDPRRSGEIKQYTKLSSLYRVCEYEYGWYSDRVSDIYTVSLGGARSDLVA